MAVVAKVRAKEVIAKLQRFRVRRRRACRRGMLILVVNISIQAMSLWPIEKRIAKNRS
jgi:hypothetical protein